MFGAIEEGKALANETLKRNFGYVNYCPKCLYRCISDEPLTKCEFCGKKLLSVGYVWTGKMEDEDVIRKMQNLLLKVDWLNTSSQINNLLEFLKTEDKVPLYYDIHKVCKVYSISVPKFERIIEKLKAAGYIAVRTHFCETGIKTNAKLKTLLEALECTKTLNKFL